jgi:hypothetical protein
MKKEITKQNSSENKNAQSTHTGDQLRAISEPIRNPNTKTAHTIPTLTMYQRINLIPIIFTNSCMNVISNANTLFARENVFLKL